MQKSAKNKHIITYASENPTVEKVTSVYEENIWRKMLDGKHLTEKTWRKTLAGKHLTENTWRSAVLHLY